MFYRHRRKHRHFTPFGLFLFNFQNCGHSKFQPNNNNLKTHFICLWLNYDELNNKLFIMI